MEPAARRTRIHDLATGLPRGYRKLLFRVYVYEGGQGRTPRTGVLSGGRWQRIALAWAFLRDVRDLLILDEPTSGLDAEAEYVIHAELTTRRAGWTSVLISRRLGSVRDTDRIAALVDGLVTEMMETGRANHLRRHLPRLYRRQASDHDHWVGV